MIDEDRPTICKSCAHLAVYFRVSPSGQRMVSRVDCTNPHVVAPTKGCAWHAPRRDGVATHDES